MIGLSKPGYSIAVKKGPHSYSSTALEPVVKLVWPLSESVQLSNPAENYSLVPPTLLFCSFSKLKWHARLSDKYYSDKGKQQEYVGRSETCLFGGSKQSNKLSCLVKPKLHKQPCNLICGLRNPLSIEESL